MALRAQKVSVHKIFFKYAPLMGYKYSESAFRQILTNHIVKDHSAANYIVIPQTGNGHISNSVRATLENFGQRLLELGAEKLENMPADKVNFKDVISAQKLILDSKKLKLSEDAMSIMMGKLFAPTSIPRLEVVGEGEIVDEDTDRGIEAPRA